MEITLIRNCRYVSATWYVNIQLSPPIPHLTSAMDLHWNRGAASLALTASQCGQDDVIIAREETKRREGRGAYAFSFLSRERLVASLRIGFDAYEVIKENRPARLYVDLEWHPVEGENALELARDVCEALLVFTDRHGDPFYLLNSCRPSRNSFHAIFTGIIFPNNHTSMKRVMREFCAAHPNLARAIDLSVYTRNRLFRLPFSSKGGRHPLMPLSDVPIESYLVTTVNPPNIDTPPPAQPVPLPQRVVPRVHHLPTTLPSALRAIMHNFQGDIVPADADRELAVFQCRASVHPHVCQAGVAHESNNSFIVCEGDSYTHLCYNDPEHTRFLGDGTRVTGYSLDEFRLTAEYYLSVYKEAWSTELLRERLVLVAPNTELDWDEIDAAAKRALSRIRNEASRAILTMVLDSPIRFPAITLFYAQRALITRGVYIAENLHDLLFREEALGIDSKDSRIARVIYDQLRPSQWDAVHAATVRFIRPLVPGDALAVRAGMGLGKTHAEIAFSTDNPDLTVLTVGCRRSLNTEKCERYGERGVPIADYRKVNNEALAEAPRVAILYESLHRLLSEDETTLVRGFDAVMLDEVNTIFTQATATTNGNNLTKNARAFRLLVHQAKTVFAADALLDNHSISVLRSLLGSRLRCEKYLASAFAYSVVLHRQAGVAPKETRVNPDGAPSRNRRAPTNSLLASICAAASNGLKIFVGSASVSYLQNHVIPELVQFYTRDEIHVLTHTSCAADRAIPWDAPHIKAVLCSPTVTVGITFDVRDHFDIIFSLACTGSCGLDQTIQQQRRVRFPRSAEIHLAISRPARVSPKHAIDFISVDKVTENIRTICAANLGEYKRAWRVYDNSGTLDAWAGNTNSAKEMPPELLINYAMQQMKTYLFQAFPDRYARLIYEDIGVRVISTSEATLEGISPEPATPSHWWDETAVISPLLYEELKPLEISGECSTEQLQQIEKFELCRLFRTPAGDMYNLSSTQRAEVIPIISKLFFVHAWKNIVGAEAARRRELCRRETEKTKGIFIEQWPQTLTRINALDDIVGAIDADRVARDVTPLCEYVGTVEAESHPPIGNADLVAAKASLVHWAPTLKKLGVKVPRMGRTDVRWTWCLESLRTILSWIGIGVFPRMAEGRYIYSGGAKPNFAFMVEGRSGNGIEYDKCERRAWQPLFSPHT